MYQLVAVSFLVAGIVQWRLRPGNRMGPLLVVTSLLWTLAKVPMPVSLPDGLNALRSGLWAAALAHLVIAFPTGRLESSLARLGVGLASVAVASVGCCKH